MSATASNEVETNMEQLERNKLHEEKFYDALNADRLEKEMNCKKSTYQRLLTRNEYQQLIVEIEEASATKTTKTARQYYLLKTYEIFEVADVKKIIGKRKEEKDPVIFLVPFEDIFQTILMCHRNVGHKGRDIMSKECSKKYMNLTADLITRKFISL